MDLVPYLTDSKCSTNACGKAKKEIKWIWCSWHSKYLHQGWDENVGSNNESTNEIYINGQKLDYNKKYRVAAIDYIFDNAQYPFLYGENITVTNKLFREILVERVEKDGSIIIPFRKTY